MAESDIRYGARLDTILRIKTVDGYREQWRPLGDGGMFTMVVMVEGDWAYAEVSVPPGFLDDSFMVDLRAYCAAGIARACEERFGS